MPFHRTPTRSTNAVVLCGLLALAAAPADAITLEAPIGPAALGAPLDVELGVSLARGETLDPQCVRAEVVLGDRTLAAEAVRTRLGDLRPDVDDALRATLRVQTTVRVDEPVVELSVHAGCPPRMTRRYVVFADPPRVEPAPALASGPGAAASDRAGARKAQVPGSPAGKVVSPPAGARTLPPAGWRPDSTASPPAPAPPAKRAVRPARADASSPPPRGDARASPPRPAARARLRLDGPAPPPAHAAAARPVPEPAEAPAPPLASTLSPQTLALVEQANLAVLAAAAELRAAQARMAALEHRLETLQAQASTRAAQVDEWRQLAVQAQTRQRWSGVLLIAVLLLLGLAGWLWWRVRMLERKGREAWTRAAHEATALTRAPLPATQVPVLATAEKPRRVHGAGLAPVHEPVASAWPASPSGPPAHPVESDPVASVDATRPFQRDPAASPTLATQALSTEELIDLEQQAEFFVVLGQDEAAVDLLMAHLRDSAGASPLPYLKLMEIYHRLGDEAAYRRTQQRFNQRFNARAPDWRARERIGHALVDYPTVVAGLQRVWANPIDAMAQLEALLFRRGGGEVFDLEAYRDLLFLYGIAREAHETGPLDAGSAGMVDVLLPLDTGPAALFEHDAAAAPNGAPTQPLGLDPDRG